MFSHFGIVVSIWILAVLLLLVLIFNVIIYRRCRRILLMRTAGPNQPVTDAVWMKMLRRHEKWFLLIKPWVTKTTEDLEAMRQEIESIKITLANDDDIEVPLNNGKVLQNMVTTNEVLQSRVQDLENVLQGMVENSAAHVAESDASNSNVSMTRLDLDSAISWSRRVSRPFESLVSQNERHVREDKPKKIDLVATRNRLLSR